MNDDSFDYTKVPHGFLHCGASHCAKSATCLRHLAYCHLPSRLESFRMLNPCRTVEGEAACKYFLPDEPVRYARGFMRTVKALTLGVAGTFRNRAISCLGRKNYYLTRRGERLLSPSEQQQIVHIARSLGVELDEYFDDYVFEHRWA